MKHAAFLALTVLFALCLVGCNRILYGEDTKFAKEYSERKFRQIKEGMAMQEVVSLLGRPLSQSTQEWVEVWFYWPTGKPPSVTQTKDGTTIFSNIFGTVTNLQFTQTGTVMAVSGDIDNDLVGLTKEQLLEKLGEPSKRELGQFKIIYHYTAAGKRGSGAYKRREVCFDGSNRVSSVLAEMYYD